MSLHHAKFVGACPNERRRIGACILTVVAIALTIVLFVSSQVASADDAKGAPDIKVRKPNGGEFWERGEKEKIRWSSEGFTGFYVRIELLREDVVEREITSTTPNDGKFNWVVPNDVPLDTGYAVRIISLGNPQIRDKSNDTFTIIDLL